MLTKPLLSGVVAFGAMLAIYFGVVSLISGMSNTLEQFTQFWYFIVTLALGFGVQIALYTYLRNLAGQHGASKKVVAVSGTTSTAAMVSCCAHYLAKVSTLVVEGKRYTPTEWRGAAPGGHHRKGSLHFKAISPQPSSVELQIH